MVPVKFDWLSCTPVPEPLPLSEIDPPTPASMVACDKLIEADAPPVAVTLMLPLLLKSWESMRSIAKPPNDPVEAVILILPVPADNTVPPFNDTPLVEPVDDPLRWM